MKKILSILLFTGLLNSSFAQSSYRQVSSSKDNGDYTVQNRNEKPYEVDRSAGNGYGYNNKQNSPSGNDRMYGGRDDHRNMDNRYDQRNDDHRNDDHRNGRIADIHRDNRGYNERQKSSKNNDLKAFGGGLIIGGLLGVLIASSH